MKIRIKIKKKEVVDEVSAGAGFGGGYAAPLAPEDDELNERYSTAGSRGSKVTKTVTGEEEFAGARERGLKFQKLQNYKEQMGDNNSTQDLESDDYMDTVDREFFAQNPEPLNSDDSTPEEKFKSWITKQLGDMDLTIGEWLGGGMFGEVYRADHGVVKVVGVPQEMRADLASKKRFRAVEDKDVEREIVNYNIVSDAREQDDDVRMHFPEVYSSQIIPYEDGSKIGFIHMEELQPLSPTQVNSVADAAYAIGRSQGGGVRPMRSSVSSYDTDLSKRYLSFLTSEENEKLLKRYVDESLSVYSQVTPEALQDTLKDFYNTKGAALQKVKDIKNKILEENEGNKLIAREASQAIKVIELDSKDNHSLMLTFAMMLYAVIAAAKEKGMDGSRLRQRIHDYASEWLSSARSYTMIGTKFDDLDDMAAKQGRDSLIGRPNARGLINAIKKLKDLTGLRAVDMHSDNIMARHGQTFVVVDLGLFRKDNSLQESRSFSIKIKRKPQK